MIFPCMLIKAAEDAGIKVPPHETTDDRDIIDDIAFDKDEYPHFFVFCLLQLGRSMRPGEHFENAKIIAMLDKNNIPHYTLEDYLELGLHWSN